MYRECELSNNKSIVIHKKIRIVREHRSVESSVSLSTVRTRARVLWFRSMHHPSYGIQNAMIGPWDSHAGVKVYEVSPEEERSGKCFCFCSRRSETALAVCVWLSCTRIEDGTRLKSTRVLRENCKYLNRYHIYCI